MCFLFPLVSLLCARATLALDGIRFFSTIHFCPDAVHGMNMKRKTYFGSGFFCSLGPDVRLIIFFCSLGASLFCTNFTFHSRKKIVYAHKYYRGRSRSQSEHSERRRIVTSERNPELKYTRFRNLKYGLCKCTLQRPKIHRSRDRGTLECVPVLSHLRIYAKPTNK